MVCAKINYKYLFVKVLDFICVFKIRKKGIPDSVNKIEEKKFIKKFFYP